MLKVGLTGGIGSGKTTASNYFKSLGVPVVDADEVAREVVQPGLPAYEYIVKTFGGQILNSAAQLDRAKLRQIIFSDPAAKRQLETILHPLIRAEIEAQVAVLNAKYCIIAIPLLIETDQFSLIDRVLVVDVDSKMQLARTRIRDGDSHDLIEAIIESQVSRQVRLEAADDVLDNSGNINQMKVNIDKLHRKYLDLSITSI